LASGDSERALAARHNMTRHHLRETLINALGQVIAALGAEGLAEVPDKEVALALWRDGRTVPETSQLLELSTAEVRAIRQRLVQDILENLRSLPSSEPAKAQMMDTDPLQLLKTVLLSPGLSAVLAEVKQQAARIRATLETADLDLSEEEAGRLLT